MRSTLRAPLEERPAPPHRDPHGVVVLDVTEVVEVEAQIAAGEGAHGQAELHVRPYPRLRHDEPRVEAPQLRSGQIGDHAIVTLERGHDLDRRRQGWQLLERAFDQAQFVALFGE
jgi:hypothetical protein